MTAQPKLWSGYRTGNLTVIEYLGHEKRSNNDLKKTHQYKVACTCGTVLVRNQQALSGQRPLTSCPMCRSYRPVKTMTIQEVPEAWLWNPPPPKFQKRQQWKPN